MNGRFQRLLGWSGQSWMFRYKVVGRDTNEPLITGYSFFHSFFLSITTILLHSIFTSTAQSRARRVPLPSLLLLPSQICNFWQRSKAFRLIRYRTLKLTLQSISLSQNSCAVCLVGSGWHGGKDTTDNSVTLEIWSSSKQQKARFTNTKSSLNKLSESSRARSLCPWSWGTGVGNVRAGGQTKPSGVLSRDSCSVCIPNGEEVQAGV